jgi:hypothetical protein
VEAQAGEEHLHLLDGGVLGLVEDDEGVVQCPPAHEGQRRDLHRPLLHQLRGAAHVHHVVERVVERAEVGVHLLREVSRQEAELLARLHRRPGEDDALHAPSLERRDRHRHRQVCLSGPGRADAEHDVVPANGVHVPLLGQALRRDVPPRLRQDRAEDQGVQALVRRGAAAQHLQTLLHVLAADRLARAVDGLELLHQPHRGRDRIGGAREVELGSALPDPHPQPALDGLQVFGVVAGDAERHVVVPEVNAGGGDEGGVPRRSGGQRFLSMRPGRRRGSRREG